ncbi:hypothetical protein BU14_0118s0015 [Porphyra umbilicalis]|uniref:Uncharacterized protein n=1 Tax=Porphyra umbilicalis TaxID=2786 RepID=A0A1X6PBE2_PORUM|nr:hypothetical protein BU14_0118s0015 [Porphyra umbilicalis]|eukprot:OSX78164.1 hypothetical protein BU14_0118s0015 [Porphyra umbilicalis]
MELMNVAFGAKKVQKYQQSHNKLHRAVFANECDFLVSKTVRSGCVRATYFKLDVWDDGERLAERESLDLKMAQDSSAKELARIERVRVLIDLIRDASIDEATDYEDAMANEIEPSSADEPAVGRRKHLQKDSDVPGESLPDRGGGGGGAGGDGRHCHTLRQWPWGPRRFRRRRWWPRWWPVPRSVAATVAAVAAEVVTSRVAAVVAAAVAAVVASVTLRGDGGGGGGSGGDGGGGGGGGGSGGGGRCHAPGRRWWTLPRPRCGRGGTAGRRNGSRAGARCCAEASAVGHAIVLPEAAVMAATPIADEGQTAMRAAATLRGMPPPASSRACQFFLCGCVMPLSGSDGNGGSTAGRNTGSMGGARCRRLAAAAPVGAAFDTPAIARAVVAAIATALASELRQMLFSPPRRRQRRRHWRCWPPSRGQMSVQCGGCAGGGGEGGGGNGGGNGGGRGSGAGAVAGPHGRADHLRR